MESLSPNLFVKDMQQTISFYNLLGFETAMTVPEQQPFDWAMMTKGKVTFMFQSFESLGDEIPEIKRQEGGPLLFYIQLKNIRDFHDQLVGKVTILKGLEKTFYGATEFSIVDNNGFVLTFAEDE